jgi:hypothetical protein
MPARKNASFPIVLKTIINDAHKDNKSFTLNDKQIRSRLRAKVPSHIRNTSWVANNQRDYDAIRSAFDTTYAARVAKPARAKRARKSRRPQRRRVTRDDVRD